MIIALSGYARSGKDTVARMIKSLDPSIEIFGFSYPLKQVAEILTGIHANRWNEQGLKEKIIPGFDITGREFLQRLGTEAMRNNFHKDVWVKALFSRYKQASKWVITDCRFRNEAEWVKQFGGKVVRVIRPGVNPVNAHPSETELDNWDFDAHIINDGTIEDLKKAVVEFYGY